jgi:hypothetical protein
MAVVGATVGTLGVRAGPFAAAVSSTGIVREEALARRTLVSSGADAVRSAGREFEEVVSRDGAAAEGEDALSFVAASDADFAASGATSKGCAAMPLTVWSVCWRTAQAQPLSGLTKPESRSSCLNTISALT